MQISVDFNSNQLFSSIKTLLICEYFPQFYFSLLSYFVMTWIGSPLIERFPRTGRKNYCDYTCISECNSTFFERNVEWYSKWSLLRRNYYQVEIMNTIIFNIVLDLIKNIDTVIANCWIPEYVHNYRFPSSDVSRIVPEVQYSASFQEPMHSKLMEEEESAEIGYRQVRGCVNVLSSASSSSFS